MRRVFAVLLAAWATAALAPRSARAADVTDVASSFDKGNLFDFRFRVRYDHTEKRAQIKRELEAPGQDTLGLFKDLAYSYHRDSLALRTEIGLYHGLMIYAELPIILAQEQEYDFDQLAGADCAYPPSPDPNCVNASNSTTIADGIVPMGGYDAQHNGVALGDPHVFRGQARGATGGSGLDAFDTFNLGLTWAPLSQARDDTKPTWTVTVEGQISFGNIMKFDRANPNANHGVSEGTHRLIIKTALSRRYHFFEPYWSLWYLLPIARSDSLFVDYGRAQKTKNPQMQAGTLFGVELVPFERPAKAYRLALDLRGQILAHFEGRGYSEAWELLASSPALACDAASRNPACDPASGLTNPYLKNPAFTGITTIENYASLGADLAVEGQIGPYVQVRTGFEFQHDQSHLITGDDIGTPMNPTGRVTQPDEFNPAYRPIIDQVGRRYRVDNVNVYNFYLRAQVMF